MTHKFQPGDTITPTEALRGFVDAKVMFIDDKFYHLKIPNGIATVLIGTIEEFYKLSNTK